MIEEKDMDIETGKDIEIEKGMTPILLKDLGMRYPTERSKEKKRYGLYQCQYCEEEFEAIQQHIKNGNTKSCGCLTTTHGLRSHRLYNIWASMYHRCYTKKNPKYKNYGARGIQVCERWLDVKNFIDDMYPDYKEGLSLDRVDVDGNYEPNNCRWTTQNVQAQNTRELRITNTSGYRGVSWYTITGKWLARIGVDSKKMHLGLYPTALEAAKAYERYIRLNNLEHNFTPALTEEEIEELNKKKGMV